MSDQPQIGHVGWSPDFKSDPHPTVKLPRPELAVPQASSDKAKVLLRDLIKADTAELRRLIRGELQARAEEALLDLDPVFRKAWEEELEQIDPEGRR